MLSNLLTGDTNVLITQKHAGFSHHSKHSSFTNKKYTINFIFNFILRSLDFSLKSMGNPYPDERQIILYIQIHLLMLHMPYTFSQEPYPTAWKFWVITSTVIIFKKAFNKKHYNDSIIRILPTDDSLSALKMSLPEVKLYFGTTKILYE